MKYISRQARVLSPRGALQASGEGGSGERNSVYTLPELPGAGLPTAAKLRTLRPPLPRHPASRGKP